MQDRAIYQKVKDFVATPSPTPATTKNDSSSVKFFNNILFFSNNDDDETSSSRGILRTAAELSSELHKKIAFLKWAIVERLGIEYRQPGTSHVIFQLANGSKVTVPAHKPIKPIYIVGVARRGHG